MGILTFDNERDFKHQNAVTTAALCVVPGLGQIYNGEARKGILYFFAGAANAFFLTLILAKSFLLTAANYAGSTMHVRLNPAVLDCLRNLDYRSPQMLLLCVLLGAFTLFCLRDAVESRVRRKQREIYANEAMAISEAASGSYIFHALMFVSMILLVLFLLVPPAQQRQVVEIDFQPEQPITKKPIVSPIRSPHNSENGGKVRPVPVNNTPRLSQAPAAPSKSAPRKAAEPAKQPTETKKTEIKPEAAKPLKTEAPKAEAPETETKTETLKPEPPKPGPPKPVMPKFETPKAIAPPAPAPMNTAKAVSATPSPNLVQPTRTATTAAANASAPQPLLAMAHPAIFGTAPAPTASSSSGKASALPAPAPAQSASHASSSNGTGPFQPIIAKDAGRAPGDSAPQPVPSSEGPSHRSSSTDIGKAPSPKSAASGGPSGHNAPSVAVNPVMGAPNGTFDKGGDAAPAKGDVRKPTGQETQQEPDYGPYMADLQRRIKRSWFPPKLPSSKKTIVIFKIHQNGELSNLRIQRSSGDSSSDQAALKAVEDAAPFKTLPKYSEDTIDVQFTFDYNLYSGGSGGSGVKF